MFRVEKIKILLNQHRLCLKSKALDRKVHEINTFLKNGQAELILSKSKFESKLIKLLSDALYSFSMYLADFTIMIYALNNPHNPNNKELIDNLRQACGEKSSEKNEHQSLNSFLGKADSPRPARETREVYESIRNSSSPKSSYGSDKKKSSGKRKGRSLFNFFR